MNDASKAPRPERPPTGHPPSLQMWTVGPELSRDGDGALADERDGHRIGADARHATQRAGWEALKKVTHESTP